MNPQQEQYERAWHERRTDERRAMLASGRDKPLPAHAWIGAGKCPLCGQVGPHGDPHACPRCGDAGYVREEP